MDGPGTWTRHLPTSQQARYAHKRPFQSTRPPNITNHTPTLPTRPSSKAHPRWRRCRQQRILRLNLSPATNHTATRQPLTEHQRTREGVASRQRRILRLDLSPVAVGDQHVSPVHQVPVIGGNGAGDRIHQRVVCRQQAGRDTQESKGRSRNSRAAPTPSQHHRPTRVPLLRRSPRSSTTATLDCWRSRSHSSTARRSVA